MPDLPPLTRPVRILVVGDSTAEATGLGLIRWATEHPDLAQVSLEAKPGCGFIVEGRVPTDNGNNLRAGCPKFVTETTPAEISKLQPDVAMLMVTLCDTEDRQW